MDTLRIFQKSSFERAFGKLSPEQQTAVRETIVRLPDAIGKPHVHSGLGVRPFGKYLECRAGLKLRVLFYVFEGDIILAATGTHETIARFVKER